MSATVEARTELHRFRPSTLLLALPHVFREAFQVVPPESYVSANGRALVACSCGRRPIIDFGDLRTCSQARAYLPKPGGCDRAFFFGERLHVAGDPA